MTAHSSSVGDMIDVGTASAGKPLASAVSHLLLASVPGLTALGVLGSIAHDRMNGVQYADGSDLWIAGLVCVPMLLVAWPFFATSVRRFRAMKGGWHLRAGKGGLAYRVPGRRLWSSALFNHRVQEGVVPWSRINKWYPWVIRFNGVPTTSQIVFECSDGAVIVADTLYFAESRDELVANIQAARA